jgi:hypothetical protein
MLRDREMFFYDIDTQNAASGRLDATGNFTELVEFPGGQPTSFGVWTHIVSVGDLLFFYNRETQGAASGRLDATGNFTELMEFPGGQPTSFGVWTHIVG